MKKLRRSNAHADLQPFLDNKVDRSMGQAELGTMTNARVFQSNVNSPQEVAAPKTAKRANPKSKSQAKAINTFVSNKKINLAVHCNAKCIRF